MNLSISEHIDIPIDAKGRSGFEKGSFNMRVTIVLIALLCAACSEPLAPPNYISPSPDAAESAFRSAFRADVLAHPYELGKEPDASNYQDFEAYNDKKLANEHAIEAFGAFQWMKLGKCVWERYTLDDIPVWATSRITTDPKAAYRCAFTLHYQINPPYGDPKTVEAEGFFFKEAGSYVYVGKFDNPY